MQAVPTLLTTKEINYADGCDTDDNFTMTSHVKAHHFKYSFGVGAKHEAGKIQIAAVFVVKRTAHLAAKRSRGAQRKGKKESGGKVKGRFEHRHRNKLLYYSDI